MNILFVCTGNTCRSPMAEAIFNKISAELDLPHKAMSRGISVFFEEKVNPKAVEALNKLGIDNFSRMSVRIAEADVKNADLILTMTAEHKMHLKSLFPKYSHKIFTLCEKAYSKDKPIADPYGQSADVYLACAEQIKAAAEELVKKL